MSINKFINIEPNEDIFHTSGYAKVAATGSFGASSTESFERRNHISRNRKAIRGYGDSLIGRGDMRTVATPQLDAGNSLRQPGGVPPRQQYSTRRAGPAVPRRTFQEPPARHNPFA